MAKKNFKKLVDTGISTASERIPALRDVFAGYVSTGRSS